MSLNSKSEAPMSKSTREILGAKFKIKMLKTRAKTLNHFKSNLKMRKANVSAKRHWVNSLYGRDEKTTIDEHHL